MLRCVGIERNNATGEQEEEEQGLREKRRHPCQAAVRQGGLEGGSDMVAPSIGDTMRTRQPFHAHRRARSSRCARWLRTENFRFRVSELVGFQSHVRGLGRRTLYVRRLGIWWSNTGAVP